MVRWKTTKLGENMKLTKKQKKGNNYALSYRTRKEKEEEEEKR